MRKILSNSLAAAVLALSAHAASAVDSIVPFTGVVTSTCVLTVGTPGVMSASTDFTNLSSTNAGGVAGTVAVLSTGASFKVSAISPTSFTTAPAGGGDAVSFNALYQGSGATSIGSTPGATPTTVNTGLTNLSVNLNAQKSTGTFPAGAYASEVIVRCE